MTIDDLIESGILIKSKINNPECKNQIDAAIKTILKEEKAQHKKLVEKLDRPDRFNTVIQNQIGEVFKKIAILENQYEVSNYGRVRRLNHLSKKKMQSIKIITSGRHSRDGAFGVLIKEKFYPLHVLMFEAFYGIPKNKMVVLKDGNKRNLILGNLKLEYAKGTGLNAVKRLNESKNQKESVTIDINQGDKEKKLEEVNSMRSKGYVLQSASNGVYYYKLKNK